MKKLYLFTLMLILSLLAVSGSDTEAAATTFTSRSDGTVEVNYTVAEDTTILVVVENTKTDNKAVKYYYKLSTGDNTVRVPLSEGAGTYKVRLCKVLADNRALLIKTWSTTLDDNGASEVFANPNIIVDYELSENVLKKAESLTQTCKTNADKIKVIYNYVVKNYDYDYELLDEKSKTSYYIPNLEDTYSRKLGICYDISCTIAGMLRHVGVDARVITGYTPNVSVYHAWNQIYDDEKGSWYTVDATYDMCKYDMGTKKFSMKKKDSEYKDIVYKY